LSIFAAGDDEEGEDEVEEGKRKMITLPSLNSLYPIE